MRPAMVQTRPAMASQVRGMSCHSGRVPASLRSCLILTAHAHRKNAAVGASTRARTRSMMRMAAPSLPLCRICERQPVLHDLCSALAGSGQDEVQILQHTGSSTPDLALTIGHGVETPLAALIDAAVDVMVLLVEEMRQRHLEHV